MLATLRDVQIALETESIVPYFQPIVELRSGHLVGFELLARWPHPDAGMILPENWIALVEENGLIGALTRQTLHRAFRSLVGCGQSFSLAVNVSPLQLRDDSLPALIRDEAEQSGFPLTRLTIEITESAILDNVRMASEIAAELKRLGCRLALDDFGTGYSSLLHLQALPFDELKVDRSFVRTMTERRDSRKIVGAVLGLGHSLGLVTVAEGVETAEQARMLLHLGCARGQGWFFGRALPAEEVPAMAAAPAWSVVDGALPSGDALAPASMEALPAQQVAQLQAIYDGLPVGLAFLDRDLRYININGRLAAMHGVSVEAHLGKTPADVIPTIYPLVEPYLRGALNGVPVWGVEVAAPPSEPGGLVRTCVVSYAPAMDEAGEVVGISVGAIDVTERRQVAEALKDREDHSRNLVRFNPHAPWVMDAEGNLIEVSPRWLELTGMSREASRGLGWLDAVHPDDLALRMMVHRESIETGAPMDIEYRLRDAHGHWRWVRSRGWPYYGESGEILRWYGCLEDIDDRHRQADHLHQISREWEACHRRFDCPVRHACYPSIPCSGSDRADLPEQYSLLD